jgi:hypothetical protein
LESYHPYLPPQKVSRILKIECTHSSLPRNAKSRFGSHCPLGVKHWEVTITSQNLVINFLRIIVGVPIFKLCPIRLHQRAKFAINFKEWPLHINTSIPRQHMNTKFVQIKIGILKNNKKIICSLFVHYKFSQII